MKWNWTLFIFKIKGQGTYEVKVVLFVSFLPLTKNKEVCSDPYPSVVISFYVKKEMCKCESECLIRFTYCKCTYFSGIYILAELALL